VKKAVLLVNIGTPDSPNSADIKKFLAAYLNDPRVIMLPPLQRALLVKGVIVPFRARKSTAAYQKLWEGCDDSPLRHYLETTRRKLQEKLGDTTDVWAAMRYGNPSLATVINAMSMRGYRQWTVIPLFPQYASSTTGSIEDGVGEQARKFGLPQPRIIRQFWFHPSFLNVWQQALTAYHPENCDKVVFSFHGLPLCHLPKECRTACTCLPHHCDETDYFSLPRRCYKADCNDFAAKIAALCGLDEHRYVVTFQSRLSGGWLQPYTDRVLKDLAAKRMKTLVVAPSFVADCLETRIELDLQYRQLFPLGEGQEYRRMEALNDRQEWIDTLAELCVL
jgi:ferrochelatase